MARYKHAGLHRQTKEWLFQKWTLTARRTRQGNNRNAAVTSWEQNKELLEVQEDEQHWRRGRRRNSNSRRRGSNKGSVLDTPNKQTKTQSRIFIGKKQRNPSKNSIGPCALHKHCAAAWHFCFFHGWHNAEFLILKRKKDGTAHALIEKGISSLWNRTSAKKKKKKKKKKQKIKWVNVNRIYSSQKPNCLEKKNLS